MNEPPSPSDSRLERDFIELATRPLEGQPEIRDEARGELMSRLNYAAQGREAEVDAATARLESTPPGKWTGQAIALAVILLMATILGALQVLGISADVRSVFGFYADDRSAYKDPALLSPEQRGLLEGVQAPNTGSLFNFEKLRKTFPDDPAIFEPAMDFLLARGPIPPDYRSTWQRIDPDNGIWSYKVAMKKMLESLDVSAGTVRDEAAFQEGWDALAEALAAKRFHSYAPEFRGRVLDLVEPRETVAAQFSQHTRWQYLTYSSGFSSPEILAVAIRLQAARMEAAKDTEGFQRLVGTWKQLARRLVADARTQRDFFNLHSYARLGADLIGVAGRMGATGDERELRSLDGTLGAIGPSYVRERAMGLMARSASELPSGGVDKEAFKPGRLAEYAFLDQLTVTLALAGLLLVGIFVWIAGVCRGKRVKGLAEGLAPLFTVADFLWIAGFGVGVPLLWYLGITRLTPLGCRDIGMSEFGCPPSLLQSLAAFFLVGVMVVQTAKWRITRRSGFLALGSRRLIVGWITALLPAAVIPLTGAVRDHSGATDDFLLAMALTNGLPALWLLWQGGAMLFSPGSSALGSVLLARRLAWPVAGLCALLVAAHPLLRSIEKKWIIQDTISHRDAASGGNTKMEMLSIAKTKEAYLKALGGAGP